MGACGLRVAGVSYSVLNMAEGLMISSCTLVALQELILSAASATAALTSAAFRSWSSSMEQC